MKRSSSYSNSLPHQSPASYLDIDTSGHSFGSSFGLRSVKTANVNREMVANFHPRQTESTLNGLYIPSITVVATEEIRQMTLVNGDVMLYDRR
ncbi:hypothetical protein Btru_074423 [Bulinus truncatus]|nr:hypothetical protein Btru_074423 [Bulinus truncatus]